MQKLNKTILRIVAALLCMVLLSTSILSGIFAKFVIQKKTDFGTVAFKKWGITIEPGSDLNAQYKKNGDTIVINSSTAGSKLIAPGSVGCIAYFKVKAESPEVKFNIDFNGTATIKNGYNKESKFIRDENGKPMDYFPIILYLVVYEVQSDGKLVITQAKNNHNKVMDFTISNRKKQSDGKYSALVDSDTDNRRYSFSSDFVDGNLQKLLNGTYKSSGTVKYPEVALDNAFDTSNIAAGTSFNRIYTLQWCWPYNSSSSYPKSAYKGEGAPYQTRERDTQLGEAMLKASNDFALTFDVEMTVTQAQ